MRNILIIENQEYQFAKIYSYLSNYVTTNEKTKKFNVFPEYNGSSSQKYVDFIDNARVWVNGNYNPDYREIGLLNIENTIKDNNIELIVMDHILGGGYSNDTGIELATTINNRRKETEPILNILPIIFLSKTEHNEFNRCIKYDIYRLTFDSDAKSDWVHKGYFGDEILKKDYIQNNLVEKINACLLGTGKDILLESLNNLLKPLNEMSRIETFEKDLKNQLDEFIMIIKNGKKTEKEIEELIQEIKSLDIKNKVHCSSTMKRLISIHHGKF